MAGVARTDDQSRVLRWVAGRETGATLAEIRDEFAARMGQDRARQAVSRLREAGALELVGIHYRVTAAGKARVAAPPPSKLPVLPEPLTPRASFFCRRIGTNLAAEQCALRHQTRGDDACTRDADGHVVKEGCPVGAAVAARLAEREARNVISRNDARKARRAAA